MALSSAFFWQNSWYEHQLCAWEEAARVPLAVSRFFD
jgi:hypothetical protein